MKIKIFSVNGTTNAVNGCRNVAKNTEIPITTDTEAFNQLIEESEAIEQAFPSTFFQILRPDIMNAIRMSDINYGHNKTVQIRLSTGKRLMLCKNCRKLFPKLLKSSKGCC